MLGVSYHLVLFSTCTLKIDIISETEDTLCFDLIGVDVSFANALRRILLSEVSTMAIEHVIIHNNTSVIQDEVFALLDP
ncbi:hypothetical protein GEMRC1_014031 [Eukaryota sp. GEM-RC1]